ncbi:MAG: hypothetical protein EOP91_01310 [Lysobacteraceae bacterium]|nr:MAG: hypothetical protein EOP91_01310 [Xanthomonadaceae bacterium]
MNTGNDDALRWQLRELRRDMAPQNDLWPGIADRIAAMPGRDAVVRRPGVRRFMPWAVAASLLLAVGVAWQLGNVPAPQPPANALIRGQAVSMALDYENALARLQQAGTPAEMDPAFAELDRSAAQILAAIDRQPDAPFLLEQLRRTYALRLQLTQRVVMT